MHLLAAVCGQDASRMIDYPALKAVHVTCVAVSYALFFTRGVWMIRDPLHRGGGVHPEPADLRGGRRTQGFPRLT
jgi:hypothetical protein